MHWRTLLFLLLASPAVLAGPARTHTVDEVAAALTRYPVNEGKREAAQQALVEPLPAGASDAELAAAHLRRARAAQELGRVRAQIVELRAVMAHGGGNAPWRVLKELAAAESNGGELRSALDTQQKAIAAVPANRQGVLPNHYAHLADIYRQLGDFDKARQAAAEAEKVLVRLKHSRNWMDKHFGWEAEVEDALGRIEFGSGHYAEAEARFRRAISYKEQDNERLPARLAAGEDGPTVDQVENRVDGMSAWLARTLVEQGRLAEAEIHARKAVLGAIGRGGQDGVQVGKMLHTLADVLAEQGRHAESLVLLDQARKNFERAGVLPNAVLVANNHRKRGGALAGLGRWPEALAEYEQSVAVVADDAQIAANLQLPTLGWVRTLLALKRSDEALAKARQLHAVRQQRLGATAYETAEAQGYAGAILVRLRRDEEAIPLLRAALAVLIPAVAEESDRSGLRFSRFRVIVNGYLTALARLRGTPLERTLGIDAASEAFLVADVLRSQSVHQAMVASSARAAAATPELAALVRREQDSRQERDALYAILADLLSRPAEQALPQTIAEMRKKAGQLDQTAKEAMRDIRQRFPEYADLVAPKAAGIAEVQAALHPGEALISVLGTDEQTLVWAIPAKGPVSFAAAAIGNDGVAALVGRLRAALDPGEVALEALPAFDADAAYRLYVELLAPVAPGWQDAQHLFVAAGGALSRLPFAVLLTEPAPAAVVGTTRFAHYRDWPWLARKAAISQLPSAASLLTLRRMAKGRDGRSPFIGFGDPDFGGSGKAGASRRFRSVAALRSGSELTDYASMPPLPDTRTEILALAKALHASPEQDVFLGRQASREAVLKADLASRRVVAFATHGLLAGEYPGVDQPALALANPGGGAHGLLALDDILTLKLDADWVVLSACNTAAGDGQGGEAMSGLGRGFFYSGSRSLLVTHWPVESVSAQQLVVGVFETIAGEPQLARAEALRRSMLALMKSESGTGKARFAYAHPLFWAPYALIGDGGN